MGLFDWVTDKVGDLIYSTGIWDKISDSPTVQKMADAGQVEMSGGAHNFIKGVTQGTVALGEGAREKAVDGLGTVIAGTADGLGIDLTDAKAHPYFTIAADTGQKIDNDLRNGHPIDALTDTLGGAGTALKKVFGDVAGGGLSGLWDFIKNNLLTVGLGAAGGLVGSRFGLVGAVVGFIGGMVGAHFLKDKFNFSSTGSNPTTPAPVQRMLPAPAPAH